MYCPNCGSTTEDSAAFCPNCGTTLKGGTNAGTAGSANTSWSSASSQPPPYSSSSFIVGQREDTGRRVLAYLIDIIPMIILALIHFIPFIGWMFYGLIHACYWLLRDINGASPGKSVLGSFVGSENGGPATTQQRIVRNIPLAIPGVLGMIPLIGIVFELVIAFFIFGGEAILLLFTGRRFGDRLAGTNVFRR